MLVRLPILWSCLICSVLFSLSAHAHELSDTQISLAEEISDCTEYSDPDQRIGCYATLCEPGYECAQSLVIAATEEGGPLLGTTVLYDLMDSDRFHVGTDGHELAHYIGRQTARHYGFSGENFLLCGDHFYYGCQHGFFEVSLIQTDTPREAAMSICEQLNESQKFFCYHGVGHGLMMARENALDTVLEECNTLPAASHSQQACWQGAFMENINSYLRGEALEGVFDPAQPLHPCDAFEERYQWECYFNHSAFLLHQAGNALPKAAELCLDALSTSIPPCIQGLGQFATNPGWQKVILPDTFHEDTLIQNAVQLCSEFPADYQHDCHLGALYNLVNYKRRADAVQFCKLLAAQSTLQNDCFDAMITIMLRPQHSVLDRREVCTLMPSSFRGQCEEILLPANQEGGFLHSLLQEVLRLLQQAVSWNIQG